MKKKLVYSLALIALSLSELCAQVTATQCNQAVNVCSNAGFAISPNGNGTMPAAGTFGNPNTVTPPLGAPGGFGCLLVGAKNSTWMIVNVQTSGTLEFSFGAGSINPQAGCYDWAMWPYGGGVTCSQITGGSVAPVRCNWNSPCSGGTGIANNLPAGAIITNFPPGLAVTCGQQFIICFSNYSSANTVVNLDFFGSAQVSCNPIPNPLLLSNQVICQGSTAVLTVTGSAGNTYTWQPGSITSTATSISVSPTITTTYSVVGGGGCGSLTGSATAVVSVNSANGNFSISNANTSLPGNNIHGTQCLSGNSFNFNSVSSSGTHSWNFGSGATPLTSTVSNPTGITYSTPGIYTISHTVTSGPCASVITQTIEVNPDPNVGFTAIDNCKNLNIGLINTSTIVATSSISSYTWNFGASANPVSSNLANPPMLSFSTSGIKTITLTAISNKNCISSTTGTVLVYTTPTSSFNATSACFGTAVTFTDLTTPTGSVASWAWDFDNNTSIDANTQHPTNTYSATGTYTVTLITTSNSGCKDTIKKTISVYALPLANFNIVYTPCKTASLQVINTSSLNGGTVINNYSYNWNDGSTNALTSIANHTYASSGPKTIKLVVTNVNGCKDSITKSITILQKPSANFNVGHVCLNTSTSFTNASTTPWGTNSYTWNYGNGAPVSNIPSPNYLYPNSGNYTVTLFVTNTDGCSDTITKPVSVFGRSVPNFGPTSICFNSPTAFTNSTSTTINPNTGAIASYSWNFGIPGGTSNQASPVYTYTTPGNATSNTTYTAWLYATTVNGCKDSISKQVVVYSLPSVSFSADSVCMGLPTTFSFSGSTNGNPLNTSHWDFNNDGIADIINASVTTSTVIPTIGNSPVGYTVYTNPAGALQCSSSLIRNIWVHPLPLAGITNTNTCINTQPLNMSGITSSIAIGTITNYAWSYGNTNSSLVNLNAISSHSYLAAGNYALTLTVTSNAGCKNTTSKTIEVWERPYGSFTGSKTCFGKATTLTANPATISGSITSFDWDTNNNPANTEISGKKVNYVFSAQGSHTVNLLLTSDKGCKNMVQGNIYINYLPKPGFYVPKRNGCSDLCVSIMDSSALLTGPAKNAIWEWDFGNGKMQATSGGTNTICYTNSSNTVLKHYIVKLILQTDSGCVDSIVKPNYITVYPNPMANFRWQGQEGNILFSGVEFTNISIGANNFYWFYNDGTNKIDSVNQNPTHYFETDVPRNYQVWLSVRNSFGCKDTISQWIEIGPEFAFYMPNTFTPNGDGINDTFTGKGVGIKNYSLQIFDRWGEKIFTSEDIYKGWDGSVRGKETDDKIDVYQWKVDIIDLRGKARSYIGNVNIIK